MYLYVRTRIVNLPSILNLSMMILEVNLQCVLTRTVKKIKILINLMDMWSVTNTSYKRLCNDKSCTSTRCYKEKNPVKQGSICYDKNCQEAQCVQIRSKRPRSHMLSVTKSSIPVRKQVNYNKCNSDDKNCQSARKYSRKH